MNKGKGKIKEYISFQQFDLYRIYKPHVFHPEKETAKCFYINDHRYLKEHIGKVRIIGGTRYDPWLRAEAIADGNTKEEAIEKTRKIIEGYLEKLIRNVRRNP